MKKFAPISVMRLMVGQVVLCVGLPCLIPGINGSVLLHIGCDLVGPELGSRPEIGEEDDQQDEKGDIDCAAWGDISCDISEEVASAQNVLKVAGKRSREEAKITGITPA